MATKFQSAWARLTMIPGSGRNFTLLSNAVRLGTRLRTIYPSMRSGELSGWREPGEEIEGRKHRQPVCCKTCLYLRDLIVN